MNTSFVVYTEYAAIYTYLMYTLCCPAYLFHFGFKSICISSLGLALVALLTMNELWNIEQLHCSISIRDWEDAL